MTSGMSIPVFAALSKRFSEEEINDLVQKTCVAVRGPKPMAVLSKRNITADFRAPEPNTWEELVEEFRKANFELAGKTVKIETQMDCEKNRIKIIGEICENPPLFLDRPGQGKHSDS